MLWLKRGVALQMNKTAKSISYLHMVFNLGYSPGIPQPSRNSVDGNMNPALHPLVSLACPVAPHQFYLQVVQGVDVGEAVTDGAL